MHDFIGGRVLDKNRTRSHGGLKTQKEREAEIARKEQEIVATQTKTRIQQKE